MPFRRSQQRTTSPVATSAPVSSVPTTFMNSVTSGLGTGIGFGIGNRLFGAGTATPVQPPLTVDPCNEMKIRLFAMNQNEDRYERLFEEYEKLCIHTK